MCNSSYDTAKPGNRNRCLLLFFCLLAFCLGARAQELQATSEIPIERCDLLPIVKVRIDGVDMRFLLDTAATSMLNLKSFSSGRSKEIQVTSWSGTAATSAREVFLPEILFGDHRLRDLRLPAIDLSPIGNACGGKIDGILGVDLLDKMGVTIDLKRRVASISTPPANAGAAYKQMEAAMHHCTSAFESGAEAELEDCFDPEIILFALQREYRGRKEVMDYLHGRFLQYAPKLSYKMKLDDVKLFGDALWYTYDYEIVSPKEHLVGRGMSMCRRDGVRWRILNMHNSLRESGPAAATRP
jgi:SnoaL-like domain/Aspartyl protease